MKRYTYALLFIFSVVVFSSASYAFAATACPTDCGGDPVYVDAVCQQRRLILGPMEANCCVYRCTEGTAAAPSNVDIDAFDTGLELSTPEGVASLIALALQMFLGVVAIFATIMAIRSAILLSRAGDADAMGQARKNMTSALIGLVICGTGLLLLQFLVNLLGLGSINEVFNALGPFLSGGN